MKFQYKAAREYLRSVRAARYAVELTLYYDILSDLTHKRQTNEAKYSDDLFDAIIENGETSQEMAKRFRLNRKRKVVIGEVRFNV